MTKLFSVLFLALITLSFQVSFAKDVEINYDETQAEEAQVEDEYDFMDNSQYLTDEQLQDAKEIDDIDDKSGFEAKIINSSHFSSGTATKTYIPINKIQK